MALWRTKVLRFLYIYTYIYICLYVCVCACVIVCVCGNYIDIQIYKHEQSHPPNECSLWPFFGGGWSPIGAWLDSKGPKASGPKQIETDTLCLKPQGHPFLSAELLYLDVCIFDVYIHIHIYIVHISCIYIYVCVCVFVWFFQPIPKKGAPIGMRRSANLSRLGEKKQPW